MNPIANCVFMVKESKYLDEIKVGLIFMVKITIWVRTVVLAEVCALHSLCARGQRRVCGSVFV